MHKKVWTWCYFCSNLRRRSSTWCVKFSITYIHKESYPVTEFERDDWRLWHGPGLMRLIYDKAEAPPEREGGPPKQLQVLSPRRLSYHSAELKRGSLSRLIRYLLESQRGRHPLTVICCEKMTGHRSVTIALEGLDAFLSTSAAFAPPPRPLALQVRIKGRKGSSCSCLKLCLPCLSFAQWFIEDAGCFFMSRVSGVIFVKPLAWQIQRRGVVDLAFG